MRRLALIICLAAAMLFAGAGGSGAAYGGDPSPSLAAAGVSAPIVIEPTASATDVPQGRQLTSPPATDAMAEVTREALVIAAWILGILFVIMVVLYVLYHIRRQRRRQG